MRRFDREIIDPVIINAMMKEFDTLYLGLIDGDYPYVVPVNFGYMMKDDQLLLYIHTSKQGHKIDLIHKSQNVSVTFSRFNDFPDKKYKMHYHDYRSVMAKGHIHLIEPDKDFNKYKQAFELLYTCNHREVKPLDKEHLPPMNIYEIVCDMKDVTAKSEFPLRTIEDVPFMDIYSQEDDQTPFDISDIIAERKRQG
ncbi:MAG: pyridoxamine 5'-phosphate oxidase family protein [Coprobacillus sp.]